MKPKNHSEAGLLLYIRVDKRKEPNDAQLFQHCQTLTKNGVKHKKKDFFQKIMFLLLIKLH